MATNQYIGYPEAKLFQTADTSSKVLNKLLWGDLVVVLDEISVPSFTKIKCRGAVGWVKSNKLQANKLLEVCFVDVGQGDGSLVITPDDKFILIDAGKGDNMVRFLNWRFNLKNRTDQLPIEMLIITHSDEDHYGGFDQIINHDKINIKRIYHNGIMERAGNELLGPRTTKNGKKYLSDIIQNLPELKSLFDIQTNRGGKKYPKLMHDAYQKKGIQQIDSLEKGTLIEGFDENSEIRFEVLAPVSEQFNGKKHLRVLGDDGETKNGHSVVIKAYMGHISLLLGGDLNEKSQEYLTEHYTGYNPLTTTLENDIKDMIAKGRLIFESDVAKSCHHGSDHFMDDFLSFINPIATVISSGDNETHTHPRPETLGAIGKNSRGKRPLIFSTELARSTNEKRAINMTDYEILRNLYIELKKPELTAELKNQLKIQIAKIESKIERNVAVYGMINLRTDGNKIMIAQKKEQKDAGYIYWLLELNEHNKLEYKA
ncbi:MAG: MBL fold metallo-hydrolase [Bacteroidota bacterium]